MTTIYSPFPPADFPIVWRWLHEFPAANLDDFGPKDEADFIEMMHERAVKEKTWAVYHDGALCGIVSYLPVTKRDGMFHGICFTQSVHGKGVAKAAVYSVLQKLVRSGVDKVSAGFFADNPRVHRFLASLGGIDEGLLRRQTVRDGIEIDIRLIAFFKENICL